MLMYLFSNKAKLNNLIEQRKQFEAQENFAKGETLSHKIMTLQNDLKQF